MPPCSRHSGPNCNQGWSATGTGHESCRSSTRGPYAQYRSDMNLPNVSAGSLDAYTENLFFKQTEMMSYLLDQTLVPQADPQADNHETLSHVPTEHQGFPSLLEWNAVLDNYMQGLNQRKRDKALITEERLVHIFDVLTAQDMASVTTPQFRFWVRKMFKLEQNEHGYVVIHDGRPVAIKEHIYDILCMCHEEAGHGGRDKTCIVLRQYYTWIPKDLVAGFVKACPTCQTTRSGAVKVIEALRQPRPTAAVTHTKPVVFHTLSTPRSGLGISDQNISLPPLMDWLSRSNENDRFNEDKTLPRIQSVVPPLISDNLSRRSSLAHTDSPVLETPRMQFERDIVSVSHSPSICSPATLCIPIDPVLLAEDIMEPTKAELAPKLDAITNLDVL